MHENNIKIRSYNPGDEEDINNLFNRVFNKARPLKKWKWMYTENPFYNKDLAKWITIAEKEGRIIGHYASWAINFKFGNRIVTAAEPIDTVVDPSRRGIKLLTSLIEQHKQNNHGIAAFAYGFPNKIAYEIGERFFGYKVLGVMIEYFRRLSLRCAVKNRFPKCPSLILNLIHKISQKFYSLIVSIKIRRDKQLCIKMVHSLDERVNSLWNITKDRYGIMTVRDQKYLNWRYSYGSYTILIAERMGTLEGYAILKIEEKVAKVGLIMDFLSVEKSTLSLLHASLEYFIEHGTDYVLCSILKEDPFNVYLKGVGFHEHSGFQPIPVVYSQLSSEIDIDFLKNPANWHLCYGDKER